MGRANTEVGYSRESDRKKLGFSFEQQYSQFDKVVEFIKPPVNDFVLINASDSVLKAYARLVNPTPCKQPNKIYA